jgi:homoserine dehydrogenase
MANIRVLKFGGSVLRDENDLPLVVHEIYRHWREGSKVLAVVSAFDGTTDELLRRSRIFHGESHPDALAGLLLTGEATSAALLTMALNRSGIPARPLSAAQIGLRTAGNPLDAEPISADTERLRSELESAVVVVSGFGGINAEGGPTLLGRGGSDFTALFLAEKLGARCVLVKDVPGLYEFDPASSAGRPRRFAHASYDTALRLGGDLLQRKSVRFAGERGLTIEINSLGSTESTRIGNLEDKFAATETDSEPLRVALLGCGTVGGGVFSRLADMPEFFEVTGVANLTPAKAADAGVPDHLIARDPVALIERDCDVVVELIGGTDDARSHITRALAFGRHVVSANKALLAEAENELQRVAWLNDVQLRFSAAVGGAVPALEFAERTGRSESLKAFSGVLNGTCNYVCDKLALGVEFGAAVAMAQRAGFAEANPELDLDGTDAAQKLILLARAAFGADLPLAKIDREGIKGIDAEQIRSARRIGKAVKLVADCRNDGGRITGSVRPREVPLSHPFAQTFGADNCVIFKWLDGGTEVLRGRGAGRYATAEAVIADLFDIRRTVEKKTTEPVRKAYFTAEAGR